MVKYPEPLPDAIICVLAPEPRTKNASPQRVAVPPGAPGPKATVGVVAPETSSDDHRYILKALPPASKLPEGKLTTGGQRHREQQGSTADSEETRPARGICPQAVREYLFGLHRWWVRFGIGLREKIWKNLVVDQCIIGTVNLSRLKSRSR